MHYRPCYVSPSNSLSVKKNVFPSSTAANSSFQYRIAGEIPPVKHSRRAPRVRALSAAISISIINIGVASGGRYQSVLDVIGKHRRKRAGRTRAGQDDISRRVMTITI